MTGAGSLAVVVVLLAAVLGRPEMDAFAVAVQGFAFIAVGAVGGHFSDRMRATHAREERLLRSGLRLGAVSTREQLAQEVMAEVLAMPGVHASEVAVEGVTYACGRTVRGLRSAVPMLAHGAEVGRIEAFHNAPLPPEDRAGLELLARQTALTAENLRLLGLDRERAALEVRLREVGNELLESRSGAGLLIRAQEDDRRRLADKLHEELAQVLAAVLMGMRTLERQPPEGRSATMRQLHELVAQVLADVRDVARELRPAVLDQLGLRAAVEALTRTAREAGADVSVRLGTVPEHLPEQVETTVYRLVEDAIDAAAGDRMEVTIDTAPDTLSMRIAMHLPSPETLLALRTRAESAGGTSETTGPDADGTQQVRVTLPAA
jgi:signal transduction histidine kinase